jgi:transcriptional regulator with XRE-family HTH domain
MTKARGVSGSQAQAGLNRANSVAPTLAHRLISARKSRGLSILQLAKLSRTSPRTIIDVENGKKRRLHSLLRLAVALGAPVQEWIASAGYSEVSDDEIQLACARQRAGVPGFFVPEEDPGSYFDKVIQRLASEKHGLWITLFVTKPEPIPDPSLWAKIRNMIENGMAFALCTPYPTLVHQPREYRSVFGLYERTLSFIRDLAAETRRMVPDYRRRVRVFRPVANTFFPARPPHQIADHRTCLIRFGSDEKITEASHELISYVRHLDEPKHGIIRSYPRPGNEIQQRRATESANYWGDYFQPILRSWLQPDDFHRETLDEWEEIDPPPEEK